MSFCRNINSFVFHSMLDFVLKKVYLWGILLHYLIQKKSSAETHRILVEMLSDHALPETLCRDWFKWFKDNDFNVEDKESSDTLKKFENEELEALLHEDSCQVQAELAESIGVDCITVSKCLKVLAVIQKHLVKCEQLLQWQKRKVFLHHIMIGDEKWIHYDNCKYRRLLGKLGYASILAAKLNIYSSKLLLCIC